MTTDSYELLRKQVSNLLGQMGISMTAITPQASFIHDLGMDSLDCIDLMMRMEREFGLSISDEQMNHIRTVDQAIHYLQDEGVLGQINYPNTLDLAYPDEFTHP